MGSSAKQGLDNLIPKPRKDVACQQLLSEVYKKHGVLRKPGKTLEVLGWLVQDAVKVKWPQKVVILSNGCLYIYKNETALKYEKATSLYGFSNVLLLDGPNSVTKWVFKVVHGIDEKEKSMVFSAAHQKEMDEWVTALMDEIHSANRLLYAQADVDVTRRTGRLPDFDASMRKRLRESMELCKDQSLEIESENPENDEHEEHKPGWYCEIDDVTKHLQASVELESRAGRGPVPLPAIPGTKTTNTLTRQEHPPGLKWKEPMPEPKLEPNPVPKQEPKQDPIAIIGIKKRDVPLPPAKPAVPVKPQKSTYSSLPQQPDIINNLAISISSDSAEKQKGPFDGEYEGIESELISNPDDDDQCIYDDVGLSDSHSGTLYTAAYYQGDPSIAFRMIQSEAEGTFLIREAKASDHKTLMVCINDDNKKCVRKYRIVQKDRTFYLDSPTAATNTFSSYEELLRYYTENCLPNRNTKLLKPYSYAYNIGSH